MVYLQIGSIQTAVVVGRVDTSKFSFKNSCLFTDLNFRLTVKNLLVSRLVGGPD